MSNDSAILQLTNTLENTVEDTARVWDKVDRYDNYYFLLALLFCDLKMD